MKHIHINIILLPAILLLACAACKQDTSRPRADYTLNRSEKKVIGETLFPENTYNSQLMFIRHDGLYISDSHPLNPEYSDDVLSFRRFDLTKK